MPGKPSILNRVDPESIELKQKSPFEKGLLMYGGESGIRTLGGR